MGRVLAVCGLPGSGKGEFAAVLESQGVPILSMGDMVRAEVASRGHEGSPAIFGEVAADLRSKYGDDILAIRLCEAVDGLLTTNDIVLIEGLRGIAEYDVFFSRWGANFSTIAITAASKVRFQRIQSRGRPEDGDYAAFEVREKRETGWGLDDLIKSADVLLPNESELQEFILTCNNWFKSFKN
jgi:dephospho-CoA kinase